ncbi:ATP synthase F0 sector subunit b [Candidatus Rhodobacter oscarellae]|uniref:ATP synthase subunit b n=1 Tax=Candidatus Rhodobacter oscarellae TaxID=1675527 RepID=A0A0J9ECP6_9RHOB|nr:F0F1 ATP synthase subunit B [Candidatus Rhodobacter lobularis]KMW60505.1 ATP synthase F0 sector subunit b [Candidatus Rhodobacter lobularis]
MKKLSLILALAATPGFAASGPFVSLSNTNFVVLIAFLIFVGIIIYLKVPGLLGGMLDKRAEGIRAELDEAKSLREEAQTILASYERKQREVQQQSERIITQAKEEAQRAAEQAKEDLKVSMARRITAAEDQIASAQAKAVKEVRDEAVSVAVSAARAVIAKQMTAAQGNALIDDAISTVQAKLH